MKVRLHWLGCTVVVVSVCALAFAGCGKQGDGSSSPPAEKKTSATADDAKDPSAEWWCAEHGVPEAECSICNSKVAAKCKEKGDWCEEHQRAESQCFLCDPSRAEKFAKLYEAKFGKAPPKPIE